MNLGNERPRITSEKFFTQKEYQLYVTTMVELVLRNSFGTKVPTHLHSDNSSFRGQLSTDPKLVDPSVSPERLENKCSSFSEELQGNLAAVGIQSQRSSSINTPGHPHIYLTTGEVIIDPSIGQIIQGHPQVFVGTRSELFHIVTEQTGEGKPYELINYRGISAEEVFELWWGYGSKTAEYIPEWPPKAYEKSYIVDIFGMYSKDNKKI